MKRLDIILLTVLRIFAGVILAAMIPSPYGSFQLCAGIAFGVVWTIGDLVVKGADEYSDK